jgi:hypothetical protein
VKHLLTYKWASTYCRNAKFLLKTDEDVFVDVFQLFHYMRRNVGNDPSRVLACSVNPAGALVSTVFNIYMMVIVIDLTVLHRDAT